MTASQDRNRHLALLMRSAQDGDAAAYARLLSEAAAIARAMARKRLKASSQDIEDIVQETLLSLHAARATYDPSRPFLPWLAAIAQHRIADGARRHARRAARESVTDQPSETFADPGANLPHEGYGDVEALASAMAELPPGQRRAIELVKLRELSLREAAETSGMSVAALKVAVHRGIASLRKALGAKD